MKTKQDNIKKQQCKQLLQELMDVTERCDNIARNIRFGKYDLALDKKEKITLRESILHKFQNKVSDFWYQSGERKKMVEIDF